MFFNVKLISTLIFLSFLLVVEKVLKINVEISTLIQYQIKDKKVTVHSGYYLNFMYETSVYPREDIHLLRYTSSLVYP